MSAGVNSIVVVERELLLVESGGSEVHLAAVSGDDDRREALYAWRSETPDPPEVIPGYDQAALHHERWSPKTLCGRRWTEMAAGEGGVFRQFQEVELVPTCRSCLRAVDSWFPRSDAPQGMELLASMAADKTETFGSTRVVGVPAEHAESLRRSIRKVLRERGFRSRTHHLAGVVYVISDEAHDAIDPATRAQREREVADVLADAIGGGPTPRSGTGLPLDAIRWSTWVVGD